MPRLPRRATPNGMAHCFFKYLSFISLSTSSSLNTCPSGRGLFKENSGSGMFDTSGPRLIELAYFLACSFLTSSISLAAALSLSDLYIALFCYPSRARSTMTNQFYSHRVQCSVAMKVVIGCQSHLPAKLPDTLLLISSSADFHHCSCKKLRYLLCYHRHLRRDFPPAPITTWYHAAGVLELQLEHAKCSPCPPHRTCQSCTTSQRTNSSLQ